MQMFLEKVIMYVLACVNIYTNVFGTKLANLNLPFIFKKKRKSYQIQDLVNNIF